jgi:hypothetical protein
LRNRWCRQSQGDAACDDHGKAVANTHIPFPEGARTPARLSGVL